jgi:hypothetical protein
LAVTVGLGAMWTPGFAQGAQSRRIGEEQIFAELTEQNRIRSGVLIEYGATRVYRVIAPSGKMHVEEEGRIEGSAT